MRRRNLYVVLGISPRANQEAIRSAFRTLAKRYHPDRMGPGGAARFLEVEEAYRVLSDPEGRREHDRELERMIPAGPIESLGERPFAEPLAADPLSLLQGLRVGRPSLEEEFLDWTALHFGGRQVTKSGRRLPIDVEVILSREEAWQGGVLPIRVPALFVCPDCDGRGSDWFSLCARCDGEGAVEGTRTLALRIPPVVRDGTVWEVPVIDAGLDLRIHLRVDPFR